MSSNDGHGQTKVEIFEIPNFKFHDGTVLKTAKLAYQSFNPTLPKKALISTCFLGRIKDTLKFTSGALQSYHVIVVALFGDGESSSPSNEAEFPNSLDYQDCILAQYRLVTEKFSMDHLDLVLGFSMGGQAAYYWAAMYPSFVRHVVAICSSARTSLHNRQFLEGPKAALKSSIDYDNGKYKQRGIKPLHGLHAFGRAISTWLWSVEWFEQELWHTRLGYDTLEKFMVEAEEADCDDWDPEDLLIMAEMWQKGDISKCNDDWDGNRSNEAFRKALGSIEAKVLLMPGRSDQVFRPEASEEETKWLKYGELAVIESIWGHAAGSGANEDDVKWMDKRIVEFLGES